MSTKCTIKYSDDFHFYRECFDDTAVYLELSDKESIEINGTGVTLRIPSYVWEAIKNSYHADLSYASLTDDQIKTTVEQEVDDRIKKFEDSEKSPLSNIIGSLTYGLAENPREQQIEAGINSTTALREAQKDLLEKLKSVR